MNEEQFQQLTGHVMRDKTPVAVNVNMSQAWFLLCAIQETLSHPNIMFEPSTELLGIARQLEAALMRSHPDIQPAMAENWQRVTDQKEIKIQIDRFLVSADDPNAR